MLKMKEKKHKPEEIFKLVFTDEDGTTAEYDNTDDVVMSLADWVTQSILLKDNEPMSILFSVIVHVLARNRSSEFEEEFVENLKKSVETYRKGYENFCRKTASRTVN